MCTGCTACSCVCPVGAISMKKSDDGFKYPVIDQSKCIDCCMCKKTCPVINTKQNESLNKSYVGFCKNENIREKSLSGGIFSVLAEYILNNNGIVIGAGFDKKNKLKHMAITKSDDLEKLRSSKYLQSDLDGIFKYIKEKLDGIDADNGASENKKKILFSGTPCQIAGLKSYLKKDYDNLICIDVICHGVPTPKLFKKYVSALESKNGEKLKNYNFRDKSSGWEGYSNKAIFDSGKSLTSKASENPYMRIFLSDVALRESCYNCNFKLGNKYSDITLGDFWGVKNCYPEMYNEKGVSCIIVNTLKGMDIFDKVKDDVEYKECSLDNILKGNPSLKFSGKEPEKREQFFKDLDNDNDSSGLLNFDALAKKYVPKESFASKLKKKGKSLVKKVIGR